MTSYIVKVHIPIFCLSSLMLQVLLTLMETNRSLMNVFDWFKRHNMSFFLSQFAKESSAICSSLTARCFDVDVLRTPSRQTTRLLCPTSCTIYCVIMHYILSIYMSITCLNRLQPTYSYINDSQLTI
jgi:hypothetical protein